MQRCASGGVLNPDVHSASTAGENVIQIKDSYGEEDRGGERTKEEDHREREDENVEE